MVQAASLVTFITPVAYHHRHLALRAAQSVRAQTIPCEHILIEDFSHKGAGWARNQGLMRVTTPFLVFLDADDEVEPTFAEKTAAAYQLKKFVYTDWYDLDRFYQAPDCPFLYQNRSVITTLIATEDALHVNGFDEALKGMEDTHFYLKLMSNGVCGLHLHEPLFRYSPHGQRSKAYFEDKPAFWATVERFQVEFGGKPVAECGSCGGSPYAMPEFENLPVGDHQDGDILVETLWAGNRQERGKVTGRLYPRSGNGKRLWMDPRDKDAAPHLFASVLEPPPVPTENDFQTWARRALNVQPPPPTPEPSPVIYGEPGVVKPDVHKLLRLYRQSQV